MKDECKQEAQIALGRAVSDTEAEQIQKLLVSTMREIYQSNRQLAPADLFQQAAQLASTRLVENAVQAKQRAAKNALTLQTALNDLNAVPADQRVNTLLNWLVNKAALTASSRQSLESRRNAIRNEAHARLVPLMQLFNQPAQMEAFGKEVFGIDTGNQLAKQAAQAYLKNMDTMTDDFINAGAQLNVLDNWRFPQNLSPFKGTWEQLRQDLYNHTDHGMYRHEDGTRFTDQELRDFMDAAAETIITDGDSKAIKNTSNNAGNFSSSRRGYQKQRQIHYKSWDSYQTMMAKYGDSSLEQMILSHINTLARDTALTELFSGDYRGGFKQLLAHAGVEGKINGTAQQRERLAQQQGLAQRYFDFIAGDSGHTTADGAAWARRFDIIKNVIVGSLLGKAGLNSAPDMATFSMIGRLSALPEYQLWQKTLSNALSKHNPQDIDVINRAGLGMDTILAEVHRQYRDDPVLAFSAAYAHHTTRLGGLQRFERSKRLAFINVISDTIGKITRTTDYGDLLSEDIQLLEANAVTAENYALWQIADIERGADGQHTILLPEHIYNADPERVAKLLDHQITAAQQQHQTLIDKLTNQQAIEQDWIDKRLLKLVDYRAKLDNMINRYQSNRLNEGTGRKERIATLTATMNRLNTEHDVLKLLATQTTTEKLNDLLWAVAAGEKMTVLENRGGTLINRFGRTVDKSAYELGRRLNQAKQDVIKAKKSRDQALQLATEFEIKQNARFEKSLNKFEQFSQKITDRITKRQSLINEWQNVLNMTADTIIASAKRDAALKLAGLLDREANMSSNGVGVERQVQFGKDAPRTGLVSELGHSITVLKLTSLSILNNIWARSGSMANPLAIRAKYAATSFAIGVIIMNLNNLLGGKDAFNPLDTDQDEYGQKLVKALLKAGTLSIYGDVLFDTQPGPKTGGGMASIVAGPMMGIADDIKSEYEEAKKLATGEDNLLGANTVRIAKRYLVPNIFWTQPLTNHYIFDQLQELASPGYNQRIAKKIEKNTGFDYWWQPGDLLPERSPEFSHH